MGKNLSMISVEAEEAFTLLKNVTVDSKDNGYYFVKTDRVKVIKEYLKDSAYHLLEQENLFLLYGKHYLAPDTSVVLISSHIDSVYENCFCDQTCDEYHGTFDNSFTNAALMYAMKHECLPDNVVIAFTGDEEKNSRGAYGVCDYLRFLRNPISFALVLDVTTTGWKEGHLFAVENDFDIDLLTAHRIVEVLKAYEGKYSFLHNADLDEAVSYNQYGNTSMTLSASVGGFIHSEEGVFVRKQTFPAYVDILCRLARELSA